MASCASLVGNKYLATPTSSVAAASACMKKCRALADNTARGKCATAEVVAETALLALSKLCSQTAASDTATCVKACSATATSTCADAEKAKVALAAALAPCDALKDGTAAASAAQITACKSTCNPKGYTGTTASIATCTSAYKVPAAASPAAAATGTGTNNTTNKTANATSSGASYTVGFGLLAVILAALH